MKTIHHGKLRFMRTAGGLTHHNALRKKITQIQVERVIFLDDHRLLTDITPESDNWAAGGERYAEKQGGAHWLRAGKSFPASVTKATQLKIEIELSVQSADADPVDCVVTAIPSLKPSDSGAPDAFTFRATVVVGGKPNRMLKLTADAPLADQVFHALEWTLTWKAETAGRTFDLGTTGPHRLYVTYARPDPGGKPLKNPHHPEPAPFEDGITYKRMHAAVTLTEDRWRQGITFPHPETKMPLDRNEPHHLVMMLNTSVTDYTLAKSPNVPERFNHPSYVNAGRGMARCGAWPIIDYREELAECQAIVRLIRGLLLQIGCPGELNLVAVYADPFVDGGATAQVDYLIPRDEDKEKYVYSEKHHVHSLAAGTSRIFRTQLVGGKMKMQQAFLAGEVKVGEVYAKGTVLNNFEACVEFTHGGQTRYYGGGVPSSICKTPQDVLGVFRTLVWASPVDRELREDQTERWRIDEIVQEYEQP